MKQLKVVTIVGTRPEIIKLSRVISRLEEFTKHILIHTGQNYDYELNQIFFDQLGLRLPDYYLEVAQPSLADTIGLIISRVDAVLAEIKPDALLVLGDTNSCLSVIPAKRRKIPIFHMEAGNRCFDQRVPEEINRIVVDHISDINMPYSNIAREYLLREGIPSDRIIKTGSPMREVLEHYRPCIESSNILERLNLNQYEYFTVSAHREENVDSNLNLDLLCLLLNQLAERYNKKIIMSTHPRTQKRLLNKAVDMHPLINFLKPLGFFDYIQLQKNSLAVLSDSGTITEEASILNFPALNIREAHERPEGMEEAAVIMTGLDINRIYQGLEVIFKQKRDQVRSLQMVSDYLSNNVSEKVLRIIISYTSYINRTVWYK